MAPVPTTLRVLFKPRSLISNEPATLDSTTPATTFVKRATSNVDLGAGSAAPESFHNAGILFLFAFIGTSMVVAAIWFFFWAKNGGFKFREGDWEDYKSTVLRRKGPDGRTLSNATKSTRLGLGTIAGTQRYAWAKHYARSVVSRDEKGRKGVLGKRGWGKTHSITYSDDILTGSLGTQTVSDEMTEFRSEADPLDLHSPHAKRYRDRDVTAYKKEKPARVGGLNRIAEGGGSHFDNSERSDLLTDEASEAPMLTKKQKAQQKKDATARERAERKAREDAKKMERRWKEEAEAAAAALARENLRGPPAPTHSTPPRTRTAAVPTAAAPSGQRQRHRSRSRSASPKKRDFSYTTGPESETLYSGSSETRTASYYDAYRPQRASEPPRRQSSPRKKAGGGYRRGGGDSDFE